MQNRTPEEIAREKIDAMLIASGWIIQNYKSIDLSVGRGITVREVPLKTGPCDYLLVVDRKPVGVVEAKRQGTTLSTVAEQSGRYASSLPDFLAVGLSGPLPFLYESTGVETFFRDERDPEPRSRAVFSFHRPETLAEWLTEPDTLRHRLQHLTPLPTQGMRDCQVEGITDLEKSLPRTIPGRSSKWPLVREKRSLPVPSPTGSSNTPGRVASFSRGSLQPRALSYA
jgi:type I restriction enzyme R subunit